MPTQIWVVIEDWYVVLLFIIVVFKNTAFYKTQKPIWTFCEYFKILQNMSLSFKKSYFKATLYGLLWFMLEKTLSVIQLKCCNTLFIWLFVPVFRPKLLKPKFILVYKPFLKLRSKMFWFTQLFKKRIFSTITFSKICIDFLRKWLVFFCSITIRKITETNVEKGRAVASIKACLDKYIDDE